MGQAKLRGSKEEREAIGIKKRIELEEKIRLMHVERAKSLTKAQKININNANLITATAMILSSKNDI